MNRGALLSVVLVTLLVACDGATPTASVAQPSVAPPASGTAAPSDTATTATPSLQVVLPDGSTKVFTLADLQKLPQSTITADGQSQSGPALPEVLKAAGAGEFTSVIVSGDGRIELTREQVTADVVLDFTNRGTVKLAGTTISKDQWVKDVAKIEIK